MTTEQKFEYIVDPNPSLYFEGEYLHPNSNSSYIPLETQWRKDTQHKTQDGQLPIMNLTFRKSGGFDDYNSESFWFTDGFSQITFTYTSGGDSDSGSQYYVKIASGDTTADVIRKTVYKIEGLSVEPWDCTINGDVVNVIGNAWNALPIDDTGNNLLVKAVIVQTG